MRRQHTDAEGHGWEESVDTERIRKIDQAIKLLSQTVILVGIPRQGQDAYDEHKKSVGSTKRAPDEEGHVIENATLGYIHEYGSEAAHIPARPWLVPGVKLSREKWSKYLRQAGEAVMQGGDPSLLERRLHAAGQTAVSAVKVRIVAGLSPELSQRTVDARRRRVRSRKAKVASDTTPLVDTAQMLNSISYVITKRKDKSDDDSGEEV